MGKHDNKMEIYFEDPAEEFGFTPIPNVVLCSPKLPDGAKVLYGVLKSYGYQIHSGGTRPIFPEKSTLAKDCGCKPRAIDNKLQILKEFGLIDWEPRFDEKGAQISNRYHILRITSETIEKLGIDPSTWRGRKKMQGGDAKKCMGGAQKNAHEERKEEERKIKKKETAQAPALSQKEKEKDAEQIAEVWKHWTETFSGKYKRAALTEKRKKAIRARLKDGFTVEDLKEAINAASRSEWHVKNNYFYIENIFRNYERVEGWLNENEAPQSEDKKNGRYVVPDAAQTKKILDELSALF